MRLPAHAPVLARPGAKGGIDMQVGLASPVVLSGLAFDEREFLATLEGGRYVTPTQARRFTRVVTRLTNANAWEEPPAATAHLTAAIHGAGALGMEIAALIHQAGMAVALHDPAPMRAEPVGTYAIRASGTCAGAAVATLAARGLPASIAGGGEDAVVIVCTGAPEPLTIAHLMRTSVPHILVVCDEATVWVSHVIVPGMTPCSRCRDTALTRADPAWPLLALQLGGCQLSARRPAAHRLAGPHVAARVATRLLGWFEREDAGCAERIAADGTLTAEPIAAEDDCGCGAAGPIGDEETARRVTWTAAEDA